MRAPQDTGAYPVPRRAGADAHLWVGRADGTRRKRLNGAVTDRAAQAPLVEDQVAAAEHERRLAGNNPLIASDAASTGQMVGTRSRLAVLLPCGRECGGTL